MVSRHHFRRLTVCSLLLLAITLTSCATGVLGPETVPSQNRIALTEENESGAWDTGDLVVSYRFQREPGRLEIAGKVNFFGSITNFDAFERFSLTLYLLNGAGRIIGSHRIAASGYYQDTGPIPFDKRVELPEGTAAFAFGYSGTVLNGGSSDEGGSRWRFWETPGA
jgi:hypothetical protein